MRCAGAPAAADAIERAAFAVLDRRLEAATAAPVALALSGGGDSMALLLLAAAWAREQGRRLLALTVDHGLNPDSRAWTAVAGRAAAAAGADWRALAWEGPKPDRGLPAAARGARHRLLAAAARDAGAHVLLTGHTLDDVREGERMREADAPTLGRLREWSPSPAWPEGRGVFLARPLLALERDALRDWLRARSATWIEDPANEDPRYARSRARLALRRSPAPAAAPDEDGAAGAIAGGSVVTIDGRIITPRRALQEAGARRFLSAALLCAAGGTEPPRGAALERLLERLAAPGRADATLAGARIVADAGAVQIGRDAGERLRGGLAPAEVGAGETMVWDGRFEIVADEALRIEPLGGLMGRLTGAERARLKPLPAWARGALPAAVGGDGRVALPAPLGAAAAAFRSLAELRLASSCGLIACEADIVRTTHGADASLILSSAPTA